MRAKQVNSCKAPSTVPGMQEEKDERQLPVRGMWMVKRPLDSAVRLTMNVENSFSREVGWKAGRGE